ncbi:hypothetical protein [Treponema sp.]|uniref:hypothetical protein n=1 Tax=Treponema sp. TaxID=166 RepID=UPI00298D7226|nr:hypothetical protein [Treponema sp.]MCR5612060.1 hypothetical protein [Treponema sp.]
MKNKYVKRYLIVMLVTALVDFLMLLAAHYVNHVEISYADYKDSLLLFAFFNIIAIFFIGTLYSTGVYFELLARMAFIAAIFFGYQCITNNTDLGCAQVFLLFLSLGILLRFCLWEFHFEIVNRTNKGRKVKVDFSVQENSDELFYRQLNLNADQKCSDLLTIFKTSFLCVQEQSRSYKFYVGNKLIYNISGNGDVEYRESIDFELGDFPIQKMLFVKVVVE